MSRFNQELEHRLKAIHEQGLYRKLRRVDSPQSRQIEVGGEAFLNFSSNDYLGLANEPVLKEAAIQAIEKFGAGTGASRLVCGSIAPHHELDETLAHFKGTEAALSFSSGYAAAVGAICSIVGKDDIIVLDKLVHASIVDAARLSGAKLRVFDHNDLNDLERILRWADQRTSSGPSLSDGVSPSPIRQRSHVLVVTESVFSMDGDHAPLRALVDLKEKFGAWLMLDEAHATGLYGTGRRGLAEECGVSDQIEIQMGTLGKALGASGGYISGSRFLIDYLINRARSFIFSTAPVPAAAAAATAGIRLVRSGTGDSRCRKLWENIRCLRQQLGTCSNVPTAKPLPPDLSRSEDGKSTGAISFSYNQDALSAIFPLIIGSEPKALEASAGLRRQGIFVPAIRYPTVARGQARLRVTLTGSHTAEDITTLVSALVLLNTGC